MSCAPFSQRAAASWDRAELWVQMNVARPVQGRAPHGAAIESMATEAHDQAPVERSRVPDIHTGTASMRDSRHPAAVRTTSIR